MAKKDTLTFKESMVEGNYLRTLTKEEKKEYKKRTVDEKRKIIHEFNPEKFQPSNNGGNKFVSWVKKHKIWSGIIALIIISCIVGPFMDEEEQAKSGEPKKETATKVSSKEDAEKDKQEKADKQSKEDKTKKDAEAKKDKPKKPLTDEDKLKKNIKDESVTLKDLEFVNGGDEIHITIEASSAMSKKSTLRVMKVKTADTLYALKKSELNFSTANIYVSPPDEEQYAMTSRWTYDDVKEIDEDSTYTLPDEMEEKADGFMLNSYFR